MTDEVQPVEADLDNLTADYPEGTIVVLRKESPTIFDDRDYRAVVTGHGEVETTEHVTPIYPGPRVYVSGNPPGYDFQNEFGASGLRPCEIVGTDGRADPTDD